VIKKLTSLIFAIIATFPLYSQTHVFQFRPIDSKLWGYATLENGTIIEPQFRMCYEFSEDGIATIYYSKKNRYNLINLNGEIIDLEINDIIVKDACGYAASSFENGLTPVREKKKWGYMNIEGNIAINLKYSYVTEFYNGFAVVELNKQFYIIDINGKETLIDNPNIKVIKDFTEGLAPFITKKGLSGFINTKGEIVVPAQFKGVGYFKSGLAWARTKNGIIGYINKKGEWTIQPKFISVKSFSLDCGLAKVRINDIWAFSDKKGSLSYLDFADWFGDYSEGLAKARVDGRFGFMNSKQEWKIEPQFDAVRDFKNGYAAAKINDAWGIIDKNGNWVIDPIYGGIKDIVIVK